MSYSSFKGGIAGVGIASALALALSACGGSSGGGGPSGGPAAGSLVKITKENAPGVALTAYEGYMGFLMLAEYGTVNYVLYGANTPEEERTKKHSKARALLQIASAQPAASQLGAANSRELDLCDTGTATLTGDPQADEVLTWTFSSCTWEDADDDWWEKETINGTITATAVVREGYASAWRTTVDIKGSWSDADDDSGTWNMKGSLIRATDPSTSRSMAADINLVASGSDTWFGEKGSWQFSSKDFTVKSTYDGSRYKISAQGRLGETGTGIYAGTVAGGAIEVTTVDHLYPPYIGWGFPQGEKLVISGGSNSSLELRFADSGNGLQVHLNGGDTPIESFTSHWEFDDWMWGDWDDWD